MSGDTPKLGDSTQANSAGASSNVPHQGQSTGTTSESTRTVKSRRRRRPVDSEIRANNAPFYFVNSTSSSKEKRAHVMRHHVQEKKRQRKLSHSALLPDHGPKPSSWPSEKEADLDANHQIKAPEISVGQNFSLPTRPSAMSQYTSDATSSHLDSPMTMLDASRKDPFSSLPMANDSETLELVDYWTTKLTYWSGQNPYVKNQIFRTAMQHPLSFQAVILGYCARWKAQIHGLTDSPEIRRHVGQSKKQIEDAIAGVSPVPEGSLIMALTGMALGEERFGSRPDARAYLDQAIQLIRPRAGTIMPVEAFLHYVRYIMVPEPFLFDPSDRRWLVTFLRGAEELMQNHSLPEYQKHAPKRSHAFQMESPLFSLLSSGPRPSQVPQASRMYVVRDSQTQEVCRTAALIYITATLWDLKDTPWKTDMFFTYLYTIVEQHQLSRHPACETLLWLLLEQGCEASLRGPERVWSTGELLRIHKQLQPDLQFLFNEVLMSFLTLRPPIRGIGVFEDELQANLE